MAGGLRGLPLEGAVRPGVLDGVALSGAGRALTVGAFTLTLFGSAGLLFLVEPMVAKMLLPLAGGAAAVWTTSVLFFQAVLLAGYAYAHLSTRLLGPRRQALVHLGLLLTPLLVLPIAIPLGWRPPSGSSPVPWLLGVLTLAVGLPFFAVSTSGPLLQQWFARTGHPDSADPYFLYRASNLGSMLALLAYPAVIEPRWGLLLQSRAWAWGYGLLILLTAACALLAWPGVGRNLAPMTQAAAVKPSALSAWRRLRWLLLAAVPSTWMLAVTSYFTTEIRPIPLLWVIPLAIYLLTLALAFGRRRLIPVRLLQRALPFLALPLLGLIVAGGRGPLWSQAVAHLLPFFVGALLCHTLLADDRPSSRHLTEFYLWVALGGVIGGAISSVLAPLLFKDYLEYPLAVVAACLLRPSKDSRRERRSRVLDLLLPAGLGAGVAVLLLGLALTGVLDILYRQQLSGGASAADLVRLVLFFAVPAVAAVAFSRRAVRFGLAAALIVALGLLPQGGPQQVLYATRDFYGVHRVIDDGQGHHLLMDGGVIHGAQATDLAARRQLLTYYSPEGPLGDLFQALSTDDAAWNVAVIGLGAGASACYSGPGQHWTFYELDPTIARIAQNPAYFTYLRDCLGDRGQVALGDGRLTLARAPDHTYGLIILDAFGSDAIPVHLLTLEAIQLYLSKLAPGGLIAFHISNSYVNLAAVLPNQAAASGLVGYQRLDPTYDASRLRYPSHWLVMGRGSGDLRGLPDRAGWTPTRPDGAGRVWTDDSSDILRVTRLA